MVGYFEFDSRPKRHSKIAGKGRGARPGKVLPWTNDGRVRLHERSLSLFPGCGGRGSWDTLLPAFPDDNSQNAAHLLGKKLLLFIFFP